MSTTTALNLLGEPLATCSLNPLTGFLRDGDSRMPTRDAGRHGVCARMTEAFLAFTKQQGNDLSTPQPLYGFPGPNPGIAGASVSIGGKRRRPTVSPHRWFSPLPMPAWKSTSPSNG